ncbi:hypothetical protein TELCIR_01382 [Teladorsagia circumcincta]|uniref:Uncharacterized protein n=1 Tax=Teladorsagia circumcincta TaxID=45464 RepID=A0A2G9V240_TELCI|nr:hypothetical protein TELCIR_01382 [Teladorsagia circumcincta]
MLTKVAVFHRKPKEKRSMLRHPEQNCRYRKLPIDCLYFNCRRYSSTVIIFRYSGISLYAFTDL